MRTQEKIERIKVNIKGNYSNILDKKERFVLESNKNYHVFKYGENDRKKIRYDNHNLVQTSKSLYYQGSFIGATCEVNNGFIPCNDLVNYYSRKKYKTRKDAELFLIQKHFERYRKVFFGLLARQEFGYTQNYIKGYSLLQIASYTAQQFPERGISFKQRLKIAKKYVKANVISYQGQGGYISSSENICNTITL